MRYIQSLARLWPVHLLVLVISIVCQLIGVHAITIGIGTVLLLPLLYAFVAGLFTNPNVVAPMGRLLPVGASAAAAPLIVIAVMPFIAKFGTTIGPEIESVIDAGPALVLQELGNLGTIVFAFPIAVWALGMGRETIGAVHSIAREPNLAIVADRYGLRSPEGTGVMGVYVTGTLFGTFIFAVMASLLASADVFSIDALAMACGAGSGSMMAACTGALTESAPQSADTIVALAASSNILTYATGMYISLFVALPLVEWMYSRIRPDDACPHPGSGVTAQGAAPVASESVAASGNQTAIEVDTLLADSDAPETSTAETLTGLTIAVLVAVPVQMIATDAAVSKLALGLAVLWLVCVAGLLVSRIVPFRVPRVAWISVAGLLATTPVLPWAAWFTDVLANIDFLSLAVPVMVYAGLAVSSVELQVMRRSGLKIVLVATLVFLGTFTGSAAIAEIALQF